MRVPRLLPHARGANQKHDLTGMLLYIGGSFFQVLEGPPAIVDAVYATIARDKRHLRLTQIIREPIEERTFTEWSMGFSTVDPLEAGTLIGQNDFFTDASCVTRLDSGRAKTLLASLAHRRWKLERSGMFRALGRG